jgi:hypothetical protein
MLLPALRYIFNNLFSIVLVVAAATERINSLAKHFAGHRKDYASKRGFQVSYLWLQVTCDANGYFGWFW